MTEDSDILFSIKRNAETGFRMLMSIYREPVTCVQSYTAPRLDWIFGHRRNFSGIVNPARDYKILESIQYYSLEGRPLSEAPYKGFYIERLRYDDGTIATVRKLK